MLHCQQSGQRLCLGTDMTQIFRHVVDREILEMTYNLNVFVIIQVILREGEVY